MSPRDTRIRASAKAAGAVYANGLSVGSSDPFGYGPMPERMDLQEALARLMRGRTSVVIAHRLSTIRKADKILVLHRGVVREEGRHHELLAQQGVYHRLHQLQHGGEGS